MLALVAIGAAVWYRSSVTVDPKAKQAIVTHVTMVPAGSDDFWKLVIKGAEAGALHHNAELTVKTLSQNEGVDEQMKILIGLLNEETDGLAISPLDADEQTHQINRLTEKMHVVTLDSDAPLSNRQCYVGTSNYLAGKIAHELVREALPEGGKVAVFLSNLTKDNMQERKEGYEAEEQSANNATGDEGATKWETVEYMLDQGSEENAKENILQSLRLHEDIACLVGMNVYQSQLFLDVLKEVDKLGKVKIIAFDEADVTLQGIADGSIHATVAQDPYLYGYEAVRMLTSMHTGEPFELPLGGNGAIHVSCQAIRKGDIEDFKKKLHQRLAGGKAEAKEEPE